MHFTRPKLELCCRASLPDTPRQALPRNDPRLEALQTWTALTDEFIAQLEIVHNILYVYPEAKKRAVDAGVAQVCS